MGFSHSGNDAILKCYTHGIETTVEVIVPSPWFPEAVKMLDKHPELDVGVHLALSSEWEHIKWRPLSKAPSLADADGYFFPMIHRNKNYDKRSLVENSWRIEEVESEFRAQIELAKRKIPRVSHVSGHMGCDRISDSVRALVRKLAREYEIDIEPADVGVKGLRYAGSHRTAEEKVASFVKALDTMQDGETYLFVEHPGLDTPELRAIHHIGYENVAADRQGVTDMWTDSGVRKHIESRGIKLISYRDLKN